MSRAHATAVLLLSALIAHAGAQTKPAAGDLRTYDGPYYVIHTDLDADAAREAEIRMTKMAEEYRARTKDFAKEVRGKLPFYLFKHERDYEAAGGAAGSAGLFDPNDGRLMAVAGDRPSLRTWYTVQHEGFHQFADAVIGDTLPIWANEGLAEYFGEAVFTGDSFVTGIIPPWRLKRVHETFDAGAFLPLREIMPMSHAEWNRGMSVARYDQAWTMVHFLVHGDGGAYRGRFAAFLRDVSRGQAWEQAWLSSLGPADGFEAKWRAYWKKLPDDPTADLVAESVLRTLTSYLARATAQRQRFANFDAFLQAAEAGTLKQSDADWLPPALRKDAVAQVKTLRAAGDKFTLASSPRGPQIVYDPKRGMKMTGRFTLQEERIAEVTVDRATR
ncbi:MAG: DUF1570 domain-containing protein [Tepidisphaeraceae bacterium]